MTDKRALLVIDMQNDYLWDKRKPMFSYDTPKLVGDVNRLISAYKEKGCDVIYIKHILPNIATNRWFIGFSIRGTEGAELYSGLNIVSDLCFEKSLSNTYTSKAFRDHMKAQNYSEVAICGLDECGCVGATAKGAAKTGIRVTMIENCIGRRFPDAKIRKMRKALRSLSVEYVTEKLL